QVVDIVGDAGIGKSRLLLELSSSAAAQRMTYLEGRCSSATQSTPFYPLLSILHAACGTAAGDGPDLAGDKVDAAARQARVDGADVALVLTRLLTAEPAPYLDPDMALLKRRFFGAVRQ